MEKQLRLFDFSRFDENDLMGSQADLSNATKAKKVHVTMSLADQYEATKHILVRYPPCTVQNNSH